MTTLLLAAALASQQPTGAQIVSECLAYYHGKANFGGTITSTFTVNGKTGHIVTRVQASNPNLFFIEQKSDLTPEVYRAVSDGKRFGYPVPLHDRPPVTEPIEQNNGILMDVDTMYGIVAPYLPDRSIPLDIVVNRPRDLEAVSQMLSNFKYQGNTGENGEDRVVTCRAKHAPTSPTLLDGSFVIGPNGELKRLVLTERLRVDDQVKNITFTWDVNVWVNKIELLKPELFDLKQLVVGG